MVDDIMMFFYRFIMFFSIVFLLVLTVGWAWLARFPRDKFAELEQKILGVILWFTVSTFLFGLLKFVVGLSSFRAGLVIFAASAIGFFGTDLLESLVLCRFKDSAMPMSPPR